MPAEAANQALPGDHQPCASSGECRNGRVVPARSSSTDGVELLEVEAAQVGKLGDVVAATSGGEPLLVGGEPHARDSSHCSSYRPQGNDAPVGKDVLRPFEPRCRRPERPWLRRLCPREAIVRAYGRFSSTVWNVCQFEDLPGYLLTSIPHGARQWAALDRSAVECRAMPRARTPRGRP